MIQCEQVIERFSPLLDGDLEQEVEARVREHMSSCADCAARWDHFQEGIEALRDLPRHPIPRSFAESVLQPEAPATPVTPGAVAVAGAFRRWAAVFLFGMLLLFFHSEWRFREARDEVAVLRQRPAVDDEGRGRLAGLITDLDGQMASIDATLKGQRRRLDEIAAAERDQRSELHAFSQSYLREEGDREQRILALRQDLVEFRTQIASWVETSSTDSEVHALVTGLQKQMDDLEADARRAREVWEERLVMLQSHFERARASEVASAQPSEARGSATTEEPAPWSKRALNEGVDFSQDKSCVVIREKGRLSLHVNWEHPDAVASLFSMYDGPDRSVRHLARSELLKFFAAQGITVSEESTEPSVLGFVGEVFGRRADDDEPESDDPDRRRMEKFRKVWNEREAKRLRSGRS